MNAGTYIHDLRKKPGGRVLLHVCFWLFFTGASVYLQSISFSPYDGITAFANALKQVSTTIIIYYPLVYFVWPKFWMRKRYVLFILFIFLLVVTYTTIDFLLEKMILNNCPDCLEQIKRSSKGYAELLERGGLNMIILRIITLGIVYQIFMYLALPITAKVFIEYIGQRLATLELQQENTRLELNFLKAQVNPHFLFNTLNNIYGLILNDKKEQSAETVARLSSFLRYTLYETGNLKSNIIKEISLMEDYIMLEKIRLNDVVVNFSKTIDDERAEIPPLLFMPAVENAFKFSAAPAEGEPYIFINLTLEKNKLDFRISNTFESNKLPAKVDGGIGLVNLEKRLKHYFPENTHTIGKSAENGVFILFIQIELT